MSTISLALVSVTHDRYDETLKRIYIGHHFKIGTNFLERLFEICSKIISDKVKV
jgi:hypothetical protein